MREEDTILLEREVDNSCAQPAAIVAETQPVEYEYITDCNAGAAQKVADLYCGESGTHSYEIGKTTKTLMYLPSNTVVIPDEERDYILNVGNEKRNNSYVEVL